MKNYIQIILRKYRLRIIILTILLLGYYFCLPKQLFQTPTSTVVIAKNKELLGAVIAEDGQWRFPELDSIPNKFEQCILQFEDAYFYEHFGFNPISIAKALQENIKAKKVVRGGSTITQQVIRLSRKNIARSYTEKLKELVLATRLEFRSSKEEILRLYASHAPFGGNVVGLEMAAWRYFGLAPHQLSWAESATLAVLPNAPSLIYPGKNQLKLKRKRDNLLKKLWKENILDKETYELAIDEELPKKPYKLPTIASHFVQEVAKKYPGKRIRSSIDMYLQKQVNTIAKKHYDLQRQNEVHNLAILVLDVEKRKVISYVGNAPTTKQHQKDVNNVISPRSTGSTLKPFLYAQMLNEGELLPTQLVVDVPTEIAGYSPKNFDLTFDGAVPANEALTRSLNIPAVRMLQRYGLEKFKEDLKKYKIRDINKSADYYGLSLILGGAEASLWDLCKTFAGYAGTINHYKELKHQYYTQEFTEPSFLELEEVVYGSTQKEFTCIDAGSAYLTLNTLTEVNRPYTDQAWKYFESSQKIGWKTGTSFGNKDAWAIGTTPKYVVGVWVGNSDGEGRADLTGVGSAAPVMFDVFDVLPKSKWFLEPFEDLVEESVCKKSGYLALPICESEKKYVSKNGIRAVSCPYHKQVTLDITETYRVNTNCMSINEIKQKSWFVLPPLMAYYYQQNNADYRVLPNFKKGCLEEDINSMDFVIPAKYKSTISLTKGADGQINPLIVKLTHSDPEAKVFWYLNKEYIGTTQQYHEKEILPKVGVYKITVLDDYGNEKSRILKLQ